MSGHTPGPWVWHCKPGASGALHSAHGAVLDYAGCEGMWFARFNAEDAANARLIAAAPQLLARVQKEAAECEHCEGAGEIRVPNLGLGGERIDGGIGPVTYSLRPCEWCADLRALIDLATKEPTT